MTRIIIPYWENQNKPILIALGKIREFSEMNFEHIGVLRDSFHNMNDVYYDVPTEKLPMLLDSLKFEGFYYRVIEIDSSY
jgi:hypothetical protein